MDKSLKTNRLTHSIKNSILTAFILLFIPQFIDAQTNKSIAFTDYGPRALDGFWRMPDNHFSEHFQLRLNSVVSFDKEKSHYFTQYIRADIPLGNSHNLYFRLPIHYFNVQNNISQNRGMKNSSGIEIGDIEIVFNVFILQKKLRTWTNNKLSIYMTGEMYTAPTGAENKQFTDALKLLGTVNAIYKIAEINKHSLNATIGIGGGGWNDFTPPYQKHVFKQSTLLEYQLELNKDNRFGASLGATYLFAEGNRNRGIHWKTGVFYKKQNIQFGIHLGFINYSSGLNTNIQQYDCIAIIPISFKRARVEK